MATRLWDFEIDDGADVRANGGGDERGIEPAIRRLLPFAYFEFEDAKAEADPHGFGDGTSDVLIYRTESAALGGSKPIGRITFREER